MLAHTLLLVHTPRQRFIVNNSDVYAIRAVHSAEAPVAPAMHVALGTLFDPADTSAARRQHGMVIPLRRREITLLVDRIDMVDIQPQRYPLPALLASRLHAPWSLGVFEINSDLVVQLDLRAIARSLLSTPKSQAHP